MAPFSTEKDQVPDTLWHKFCITDMGRKKLIRSDRVVYHVASRSNNKEWFYISPREMWLIFCDGISKALKYDVEIHSLVLMSNHFHMMVSTPRKNLDRWMHYLLTHVCKRVQRKANRINHIFGGRYKPTLLWGPNEVAYVHKYVLRNPVRANLCERAEDFPFSTANERVTLAERFPLVNGIGPMWAFVPKEREKFLEWVNIPTPAEAESLISLALRRKEFKFTTQSNHQANLRLLKRVYGIESDSPR